jgi:hypothetical protein
MLSFYYPKWLYEALPALYLAGGVSAAVFSDSFVGLVSGLLLAVAGIQIRALRKRHRQTLREHRARMDERLSNARRSLLS